MTSGVILTPGRPMNASPIMPETPSPSSVSARPVATWLVTSESVRNPNRRAKAAPTRTAANTPSQGEPVVMATPNPVTAPITIIPSTPRLRTPERSTTSSPIAAIKSGVAAVAMVIRTDSSMFRGLPAPQGASGEPDPVVDQRVAAEHEEKQHALKRTGGLVGKPE